MMHCSPSLRLELTVIKCLIVASWEFVLNISSSVMIIWVWVGRGCNHLGWLFDEILCLVVVLYSRFKRPSGFLLNLTSALFQPAVTQHRSERYWLFTSKCACNFWVWVCFLFFYMAWQWHNLEKTCKLNNVSFTFCLPQRTPVNNGEAFRWFF